MWSAHVYPPSDHFPDEQLIDLIEGRLTDMAAAPMREHLAGCTGCANRVTRLERIITSLRTDALEDAPADAQARAARLLMAQPAAERPGLRRRLLAALRFDSAERPVAMGARAGQPPARQLLFLAEGTELDLRIAQADALWAVSGQLLGPAEGGEVSLQGPAAAWSVALNELGEFALPPVPSGSYILAVRMLDLDIEVPNLTVGYTV
jgi:anti-sigma factor RsiW